MSEVSNALLEFDQELKTQNLEGHWVPGTTEDDLKGYAKDPYAVVKPCLWKWHLFYDYLTRSGELHGLEGLADRRTLRLINPAFQHVESRRKRATTHTIQMSVQLLKPGEIASSHPLNSQPSLSIQQPPQHWLK